MKRITREIFKSLNWPSEGLDTLSRRPTPYNISRNRNLHPTSVYREWRALFDSGVLKKVIFLPADLVVQRHFLIFSDVTKKDFNRITSNIGRMYFLETVGFGEVYGAAGNLRNMEDSHWAITIQLLDSSNVLAPRQAELISSFLGGGYRMVDFPQDRNLSNLSDKLERVVREVSYEDIYGIRTRELSTRLDIPERTVRRRIDLLLQRRMIHAFPLIDLAAIRGFSTAVVLGHLKTNAPIPSMTALVRHSKVLSERSLNYEVYCGVARILLYFESAEELERAVDELSRIFQNFALLTRYVRVFNEKVSPSFYGK